jgi:hypothetical protein
MKPKVEEGLAVKPGMKKFLYYANFITVCKGTTHLLFLAKMFQLTEPSSSFLLPTLACIYLLEHWFSWYYISLHTLYAKG